jgi:proline racemase
MNEPRGHSAMSGAILQPPTRPDCDWGVIYIEVSGYLPMCAHACPTECRQGLADLVQVHHAREARFR